MDYPIMTRPGVYLKRRERRGLKGFFKRLFERLAIRRCLRAAKEVESILDIPCGPGRLFGLWRKKGFRILGGDLSEPMLEVARERLVELGSEGSVSVVNAFEPSSELEAAVDLVASVRFVYYFDGEERARLIRSLGRITRRYLLLQYKLAGSYKARRNLAHSGPGWASGERSWTKHHASREEIREELTAAGFTVKRMALVAPGSDRLFVLAERMPPEAG